MDIYVPTTQKELSQRKVEEYAKLSKVLIAGRRNPVWFAEEFLGIKLMDHQKLSFMNSWDKRYVLWLLCRGAGKTSEAAVFQMDRMMLIPGYKVYVSANSAAQSIEVFKYIENIAKRRLPAFRTVTDIFLNELESQRGEDDGFNHNPAGHHFSLFNGSELTTLSSNSVTIRGKRGSVFFDETAWQTKEQMAAIEHFATSEADFSLGVGDNLIQLPEGFPHQLMYASSAGDATFPFYERYVNFAKRMLMGDRNYYVCDLNAPIIVAHSYVDGEHIKSNITQESISKAIEEDPDAAEMELFNKFRKDVGRNAVVRSETIVRNSEERLPLLYNDTGKKKFVFCYDPARNFDNSILAIFQRIDDEQFGEMLRLENIVSMMDRESKKKTPLPMPQQIEIIHDLLVRYNGERAAEWENIDFYIDAGSGGGGVSAVADALLAGWTDSSGVQHRGLIDGTHKQYETARKRYPDADEVIHLIEPSAYKRVIYDALEKMTRLNLMKFPQYNNKDYVVLLNEKGEYYNHTLTYDERVALIQCNLAKTEMSYMCRYSTPNGGVQYELPPEKRNRMHDDRAYTMAMGAYALSCYRRDELLSRKPERDDSVVGLQFKAPTGFDTAYGGRSGLWQR